MSEMVRVNPETPCGPEGAHHPHRWRCVDPDCDGWGVACGYRPLLCCVCDWTWPCPERQQRDTVKRSTAARGGETMQHDPFEPPPDDGPMPPLPDPVPPRR